METLVDKKKPEYIRISSGSTTQKPEEKVISHDEPEVEVEMISLAPSFLGMPYWKFVIVKGKN